MLIYWCIHGSHYPDHSCAFSPMIAVLCVLVYALAVHARATHRSPVCCVCDVAVSRRVPVRSAPDQRDISHQHEPVGCSVHVSMSHTAADRVPGRELTAASVTLAEASRASCSKSVARGHSSQQARICGDDQGCRQDCGLDKHQAASALRFVGVQLGLDHIDCTKPYL